MKLSLADYEQLVARSVVLEEDRHGVKVLRTPENLIVKLFRTKRILSSAHVKSYAARFVENAAKLHELGIRTVDVERLYYCEPIKRSVVLYRPLPGQTLRDFLMKQGNSEEIMSRFAMFLAELHNKGVFFRSIHLNNVVVAGADEPLGLIDIADMKIKRRSLPIGMRSRNFKHLNRYRLDQEAIKFFGVEKFMNIYCSFCDLKDRQKMHLKHCMSEFIESVGRA